MPLYGQAAIFLTMLAAGIGLGLLFDVYRALVGRRKLGIWQIGLADLIYCLIGTGVIFAVLVSSNRGEIRFYIIAGIAAGAWLYWRYASCIVYCYLVKIVIGVIKLAMILKKLVTGYLLKPLLWCIILLYWPLGRGKKKLEGMLAWLKGRCRWRRDS